MNQEPIQFYPCHPSDEKTHLIETTPMPLLAQNAPFAVKPLREAFDGDLSKALAQYEDKRFEVTGIAVKVGLDIHNKPSVELSDTIDGICHTLCIFPKADILTQVKPGQQVTIRANYLVFSNWFGVVMKHSELVDAHD